jgi:hypothetical protein
MALTRAALGLTAALLWDHFASSGAANTRQWAFIALAALFFALAWLAYLRLDGARLPAPDKRLFEWRRAPARNYGDIADYTDEEVRPFDDLEDDEREFCRMAANLACVILFGLASMV